ncbi:MAG TPA: lytic transglycosylase domain-containing protein [Candidatus Competibacteraceae bacterium]|nr:lytic transglycosylase domain-containing protein [Candidatus Competibacteraceae bacterium]
MRLRLRGFSIVLTTLILAACANQQPTPPPVRIVPISTNDAVFPAPSALQPQIVFWQNVYAVWGRGQVALHDDRYMDLIYVVLPLPGPVGESYSAEQKAFLQDHYQNLKSLLRQVESKTASNAPLTPAEQRLADFISSRYSRAALTGASDRLRSQRGLRERFKRGLEISGRYDAAFRAVFREAGLPEDLAYLPHVESSFQNHASSSVGAAGMWQFMPSTARQLMRLNATVDERRDPVISAQGAARYLGSAHDRLDSWPLAITSYNHGVGGMARAKGEFGNDIAAIVANYSGKTFGFASRNFYTEFLAAREIARNPQKFFPEGVAYEPPLNLDRIRLRQAVDAPTLASYYEVNLGELIALNQAWKSPAQSGQRPLPEGTMVWLPAGTMIRLAQRGAASRVLVLAEPVSTARLR